MADHSMLAWYYNFGKEQDRLSAGNGLIERLRTQDLLMRFLPESGVIYDVGGAAGIYSIWLAERGYTVHLLDLMPLHIEQAMAASNGKLASALVGNALALPYEDHSADAVLLMGPLYHLTEREARIEALKEAYRVLKVGGLVVAVGIGRYASLLDQFRRANLSHSVLDMVEEAMNTGQHRNPNKESGYFTTAYFHDPDDLRDEVAASGFQAENPISIEGVGWIIPDFELFIQDETIQKRVLALMAQIEREPGLIGASSHMMVLGRKSSLTGG